MINFCFLSGKITNIVNLNFIYNKNKKGLSKNNISSVELDLQLKNKQIIKAKGYDEMADYIYRNLKQGDYILIQGIVRDNYVEIVRIEKF